jgi:hypothetical protein
MSAKYLHKLVRLTRNHKVLHSRQHVGVIPVNALYITEV